MEDVKVCRLTRKISPRLRKILGFQFFHGAIDQLCHSAPSACTVRFPLEPYFKNHFFGPLPVNVVDFFASG